jgi:hypothetical protein
MLWKMYFTSQVLVWGPGRSTSADLRWINDMQFFIMYLDMAIEGQFLVEGIICYLEHILISGILPFLLGDYEAPAPGKLDLWPTARPSLCTVNACIFPQTQNSRIPARDI